MAMINLIRHGDIRYCDLPDIPGSSVQHGLRPCIIVQNNIGNTYSPCVNVIPITSKIGKLKLPCHIIVMGAYPSLALVEQLITIPMNLVRDEPPICRLSNRDLNRLEKAILIQLGFRPIPKKGKDLYRFQHDYDDKMKESV